MPTIFNSEGSTLFLNTWAAAKAFPNLKHMASYNVSNDGRS